MRQRSSWRRAMSCRTIRRGQERGRWISTVLRRSKGSGYVRTMAHYGCARSCSAVHLRPAPDGRRGPGLGGVFIIAPSRASHHHLWRRQQCVTCCTWMTRGGVPGSHRRIDVTRTGLQPGRRPQLPSPSGRVRPLKDVLGKDVIPAAGIGGPLSPVFIADIAKAEAEFAGVRASSVRACGSPAGSRTTGSYLHNPVK